MIGPEEAEIGFRNTWEDKRWWVIGRRRGLEDPIWWCGGRKCGGERCRWPATFGLGVGGEKVKSPRDVGLVRPSIKIEIGRIPDDLERRGKPNTWAGKSVVTW